MTAVISGSPFLRDASAACLRFVRIWAVMKRLRRESRGIREFGDQVAFYGSS